MSRRLLCAAVAGLLTAPAALAADHASLTIYHADNDALFSGGAQGTLDAGHALVHEQRTLNLQSGNHPVRIGGNRARAHDLRGSIAFQIAHGSKINVEAQRAALIPEDLSVPAEKLAVVRGGDLLCRRRRSNHVAETIDAAAFHVYT